VDRNDALMAIWYNRKDIRDLFYKNWGLGADPLTAMEEWIKITNEAEPKADPIKYAQGQGWLPEGAGEGDEATPTIDWSNLSGYYFMPGDQSQTPHPTLSRQMMQAQGVLDFQQMASALQSPENWLQYRDLMQQAQGSNIPQWAGQTQQWLGGETWPGMPVAPAAAPGAGAGVGAGGETGEGAVPTLDWSNLSGYYFLPADTTPYPTMARQQAEQELQQRQQNIQATRRGPGDWLTYWQQRYGMQPQAQVAAATPAAAAAAIPTAGATAQYSMAPAPATPAASVVSAQPAAQGEWQPPWMQWLNTPRKVTPRMWGNMVPSEQKGLAGALEQQGGWFEDWAAEMQRMFPRGQASGQTWWQY